MSAIRGHHQLLMRNSAAPFCDPYWPYVRMLSGFEGANGGQVFSDESSVGRAITVVGAAAYPQTQTSQKKFGTSSVYFDGVSGRELNLGGSDNTTEALYSGNFTIEAWLKTDSPASYGAVACMWGPGPAAGYKWFFGVIGNSQLVFGWYDGPTSFKEVRSSSLSLNSDFSHCAVDRTGTTLRLYHNGVIVGSGMATSITTYGAIPPIRMGRDGDNANRYKGWVDEFRFTPGVARYSGAFTPPTTAFPRTAC